MYCLKLVESVPQYEPVWSLASTLKCFSSRFAPTHTVCYQILHFWQQTKSLFPRRFSTQHFKQQKPHFLGNFFLALSLFSTLTYELTLINSFCLCVCNIHSLFLIFLLMLFRSKLEWILCFRFSDFIISSCAGFTLFYLRFTLYILLSYISCDLKMTQCKGRNVSSA